MFRWLKDLFTTAPAAPVHPSKRGENGKPLSAITQNRLLGAHVGLVGGLKGKRR
ncbi:MAG: hypothetical protein Dbin4_03020 [Alphaproteobacteria bacterium]|nr:hypothetical protein [Alphaproteobacteria bacterium]